MLLTVRAKLSLATSSCSITTCFTNSKVKMTIPRSERLRGPMLEHGIKEMDNTKLWVPHAERDRPDPGRLEIRFEKFSNQ